MNCNDFKNKVADLFDTTVDMQTLAECKEHMANCPECKAYYEELSEAFKALQPQETSVKKASNITTANHRRFWRLASAAAVFLLGIVVGWNRFFAAPAVAEDIRSIYLEQGIRSVQNVGSFQMAVYARTTPNENFTHFDPKTDFVKIDIGLLRQNDSVFYRAEKQGGRVVVRDGNSQYTWIPDYLYLKGPREANFLENFINLLYPERLLAMQKSAIDFSKRNKVTRTETDSTIILTFEGAEKNRDLQQLLETGKMDDCKVEVENVFTKNDGLLRFVKLWVVHDGQKTLLLHIDDIRYNVMINKERLTRIPSIHAEQWTDIMEEATVADNRLKQLQNETATQAAQRIIQTIISGDISNAEEALVYYKKVFPELAKDMKGCKVTNFVERHEDGYPGIHVFYMLTYPDGKQEQQHIAIRNDNAQRIWMADGGL